MTKITESKVEDVMIEMLESIGYTYLSPEDQEEERESLSDVVLVDRLREAVGRINPEASEIAREQAVKDVLNLPTQNLVENNEFFHNMLTNGVDVEEMQGDDVRGEKVWLVDFDNIENNEFVVANQFSVTPLGQDKGYGGSKRPDVVLLINGLPLVVIELKNPVDENATVKKAYTQLQNYKKAIPQLFYYNALLVASDGLDAKYGSLTAKWSRFMHWKTQDGKKEDDITNPQIETLTNGLLNKEVFFDIVKQFSIFEKSQITDKDSGQVIIETVKKIAAYHQYYAVNKAVISTEEASKETGDRKAGVVWHTQGSGKSLSMVFYVGKIVLALNNPTIVVITDRNDLDEQLFDTFSQSKHLLRQTPVQATSRENLKQLLKTTGGGIIFTTIQKFSPDGQEIEFEMLSERKNIVVIADEAHRSQYGFGAKTVMKDGKAMTKYGFAKYLRDAIPNASFIGFTGTPIENEDVSTPAVFGNYIDVYDIQQAVSDGATVRIFYESRLAKIHLDPEKKKELDAKVDEITEREESTAKDESKARWTQLEAVVGHRERLKEVSKDIVEHFESRQEVNEGKGLIVSMSRRIAVELYDAIVKIRPDWHSEDKKKGAIKVVMTSSSSDPENWQMHNTTKQERREIGDRLKNPDDELKLVIVRDMWLTGFDAPCLHTMYIDKPMKGHNLMQAIARVNRVFKDKPGGLIVDYIGIASDLKKALSTYTQSGGKGAPTLDQEEAVSIMLEKHEIVSQLFDGFDFKRYDGADTREKMTIILEAQEHILGLENGKNRFEEQIKLLSQAFALSVPNPRAMAIKEDVGFFQAVKARLAKFEPDGSGKSNDEIETAIRQIIDEAVVADKVIDIFDAAGIKKPDISILSDDFLSEVKNMKQKNLAVELLKKILGDEVRTRSRGNLIQGKKLSKMLEQAINKYHNNLLTATEVIEELIDIAKEMKGMDNRAEEMNLSEYEVAFYDALANNDSAEDVLGNEVLCELSRVLVEKMKANTAIDWTIKENVRARLRVIVKRTLRQFGYPPDMQKLAIDNVMKQAEMLASDWSDIISS